MKKSNFVDALAVFGALPVLIAIFFVGGINLVLLVFTGLLVAAHLVRRGFRGPSAVLLGQVFGLFSLFVTGATLVPLLRTLPLTRGVLFRETKLLEHEFARSYVYKELIEVTRLGSILITGLPLGLLAIIWLIQRQNDSQEGLTTTLRSSQRTTIQRVLLPWIVTSTPLLVGAVKKLRNPYEYVAATMSGDGRNFFLVVENLRVTARPTQFTQVLGQGDFLPSIAAQVSSGLGAIGRLDFRDQFSIAAVYLYMSMLIVASFVACVFEMLNRSARRSEFELGDSRWRALSIGVAPLLATLGFLLTSYAPVMNEVFRSGFFSLYGAYAMAAVFIAIVNMDKNYVTLAACFVVLILLSVTYSLALGVFLGVLFVYLIPGSFSAKWTIGGVFLLSLSVLLFVERKAWQGILDTLQGRVSLEGAIIPLSKSILDGILLIAVGAFFLLRGRSFVANAFRDVALVALAGIVVNEIISTQREQINLVGAGYYGAKNDYVVYFVSIFVAVSLLGLVLCKVVALLAEVLSRVRMISLGILGLIWSYTLLSLSTYFFPSQTLFSRTNHWFQPRSSSVEFATNTWRQRELMVLSDRDPGEARILDFWLPYFWRQPGWNWVYWDFSSDPTSVCMLIRQEPVEIFAEENILARIQQSCGDAMTKG